MANPSGLDERPTRGYPCPVNYDPHSDYYVLLRVLDSSTHAEVRTAYRALIQEAHPDKSTGDVATAAALNGAWDVLGDVEKRAAYDDERRRYLAKVAAETAPKVARVARSKAAAAAVKSRPVMRAKKVRQVRAKKVRQARSSRAADKAPRSAPMVRVDADAVPRVGEVVTRKLVQSLRNKEYGEAFGWFLLGLVAADGRRRRGP